VFTGCHLDFPKFRANKKGPYDAKWRRDRPAFTQAAKKRVNVFACLVIQQGQRILKKADAFSFPAETRNVLVSSIIFINFKF